MKASRSVTILALSLTLVGLAAACGEEGVTPKECPALPLADDPEYAAKMEAAYAIACATPPGTARTNTGAPPATGEGGADGSAGAANAGAGS